MDIEQWKAQLRETEAKQIDELIEIVFARKREVFPHWDIQYLALPKYDWEE